MIKKVLVSQPQPSNPKSPYYEIAKKLGVEFVFRPFIKVEGLTSKEFRQQRINITDYTAIVFTSRHAVDHFFNLCKDLRVTVPDDMKYFCITETVALYIQKYVQYRKRKVFFGTNGKIDTVLPHMLRHKTERFLTPQSDVHTDEISNLMESNGLDHTECVMYRTVSNDFSQDEAFDYDMLVFFSPSGINSLFKNFPEFNQGDISIATYGPATSKSAKDAGLRVDVEAPSPKYPGITSALEDYIKQVNG